jgi:hypothetical protein
MQIAYFKDAPNAPHYEARFFRGRISPDVRHEVLKCLLNHFTTWCESLGVQPILMHGALLGYHLCDRHLLQWEDHIDLILNFDDLQTLAQADATYDVKAFLFDLNPHHVSRASRNAHPLQKLEPNRTDARFIDRASGLCLNLTAAVSDENASFTKCPHRWEREDVYPLQAGFLLDVPVHLPQRITRLLRNEYGDLDRIARELPVIKHLPSLTNQSSPPMPPMKGRGIVTTASDKYVPFLRLMLASLTQHNCVLPVEVWHRAGELSATIIAELEKARVTFHQFPVDRSPAHGFACKPEAMMGSRFAEVLFLDADNSVLADPTFLFEHPAYTKTGALLWPDQAYALRREPEFRRMLELLPHFTPVESGQLVLNKRRHWPGLHMINELNRAADLTYRFTYGDKDTFCMGFEMSEVPYYLHAVRPQRLPDRSFLHSGPDGIPLFRHRSAGDSKFL